MDPSGPVWSNMVAVSHMWLLGTYYVAGATKKLRFEILFNFK